MKVVIFVAQKKSWVEKRFQRYRSIFFHESFMDPEYHRGVGQYRFLSVGSYTIVLCRSCRIVQRGVNGYDLDTFRKQEVWNRWENRRGWSRSKVTHAKRMKCTAESATQNNISIRRGCETNNHGKLKTPSKLFTLSENQIYLCACHNHWSDKVRSPEFDK